MFYATTNRVTGQFDKGHNLSDHTDFQYLPGKKYDTFFDPEGFLSTIPAITTCLLGFSRLPAKKSHRIGPAEGSFSDCLWHRGCGPRLVCGSYAIPGDQEDLDLFVCARSGRLQCHPSRGFLPGRGCLGKAGVCQPFVWIGMNSITILSGQQYYWRLQQNWPPAWSVVM